MNDEGIKYSSLYKEVELAITNIATLGFDTKEFEKCLKEIHNEVSNNVKVKYYKGLAEASYIQSYSNGIWQLEKLKNELDKFDIYVKAQNSCEYINMKLDNNLSNIELDKIVSKMIYVLKMIIKSPTIDYDNEKHIVEKIYETSYDVIKLELLLKGESQLFLFAASEDINISYFNNLILKDNEKIDLKDENNKMLKTKLFELGEKGIYSNYLNLELIKLILLTDKDYNLKDTLIKKINDLGVQIIDSTTEIVNSNKTLEIALERKREVLKELNRTLKKLRKRIASLVLSVSLLSGGAYGIAKLSEKIEEKSYYNKHVRIYSTENGLSDYKVEKYLKYNETPDGTVIVKIYDNLEDEKNYHYQEYDISDIEYSNLEDYYKYVVDNYDVEDARVEIEKTDYYRSLNRYGAAIILYMVYIFIITMADICSMSSYREDVSWLGFIKIKNIIKNMHEVNYQKDRLKVRNDDLEQVVNMIMSKINQNEELRNKFNELYEQNKYLLDNPEELYNRVNDALQLEKMEDVKKLIRERNK